jgi:ABC-type multidrug transport system fused ATPase/permease subunit
MILQLKNVTENIKPLIWSRFRTELTLVLLVTYISVILESLVIASFYPYLNFAMGTGELKVLDFDLSQLFFFGDLLSLSVAMLFLISLRFLVCFTAARWQVRIAYRLQAFTLERMSEIFFAKKSVFRDSSKSDYLRLMTNDASLLAGGLFLPIMSLVTESVVLFCVVSLLLTINLPVSLAAAVFLAFGALASYGYVKGRLLELGNRRVDAESMRLREFESAFEAIREIRFHRLEGYVNGILKLAIRQVSEISGKQSIYSAFPRYFLEFICFFGLVIFIFFGTRDNDANFIPLVGVVGAAVLRLLPSANRIINCLHQLKFAIPTVSQVNKALAGDIEINRKDYLENHEYDVSSVLLKANSIALRDGDVSIAVKSFSVCEGDWLLLDGPSGIGKSYYIDVLTGFIPQRADKFIWNVDKLGANLEAAHLITQKSYIFEGSIRENIIFGMANLSDADVRDALDLVGLHSLENVQHCQSALTLSGGERQRLLLARAILRRPKLLILDEPTSSLSEDSAREIMVSIKMRFPELGVILVTHQNILKQLCGKVVKFEPLK